MTASTSPIGLRALLSSILGVLRITHSNSGANGVEIVEAASGDRPQIRPFANGGDTDVDLDINGLGAGVVNIMGSEAERQGRLGAASGYCGLDAGTLVPFANMGTGTADGTKFLRDDRTWAAPTATPSAHASSHADGGADEVSLDGSQITTGIVGYARLGSGGAGSGTKVLKDNNTWAIPSIPDHSTLTGLTGDDHLQYHTDARGDARYQPLDADLTAIAGLTSAADKGIQFTGVGTAATFDLTAAGKALLDDATAGDQRTTLGLGTLATQSGTFSGTSSGTNTGDQTITLTGDVTGSGTGSFAATIANDSVTYAKMQNVSATDKLLGRSTAGSGDVEEIACTAAGRAILDDADATAQRATLGLVIGTNVQAYDAELAALAGLTSAADALAYFTGSGTAALTTLTAAARTVLDDTTVGAMVDTLGGATALGTGGLVRGTSPTITTPVLSAPTITGAGGTIQRPAHFYWTRTLRQWLGNPSGGTITNVGFLAAPTSNGTPTNGAGSTRHFVTFTTSGALSAVGGLTPATYTYTRRVYEPTMVATIRTDASIAAVLIWVGLFSASPTATSTAAGSMAAFRYATDVDGTAFWRCVTRDNATTNTTTTTTAIATGTEYVLRIEASTTASLVEFFINDVLVASHSSNLPVSTTTMSPVVALTALTAAAKAIRVGSVALLTA